MISEGQEMFLFGPPLQNLFESISTWFLYNMLTMLVTALFFVTKVQCSTNFILSAFLYFKKKLFPLLRRGLFWLNHQIRT